MEYKIYESLLNELYDKKRYVEYYKQIEVIFNGLKVKLMEPNKKLINIRKNKIEKEKFINLQSKFLFNDIKEFIKNNNNNYYEVKFKTLTLYICTNKDDINSLLNEIINICEWLKDTTKNKDSIKPLTIYIILTNYNKYFNFNDIMRPKNINSGYCDLQKREIVIIREEEILKVLIHELIHYYGLDKKGMIKEDDIYFYVNGREPLYNEALTEYMSLLYYNYYISIKKSYNYVNLILKERVNSLINVCKLMKMYKIKDVNKFVEKDNGIKEETNSFSYIFIKYLLLHYLILPEDMNKNYDKILEYILKLDNLRQFNYLCNDNINRIEFEVNFKLSIN